MSYIPPFMGRTGDLARIGESLAGSGPAPVVTGPPGSGKTRLLAELDRTGFAVIEARPGLAPGAPFPALAHLLPPGETPERPEWAARLLHAAAEDGPLLVLADDAHLLDAPSLETLRLLAGLPGVRLVLAAAGAPDWAEPLPLEPLGPEDTAGHIGHLLGAPPEPATAAALHRAAGGDLAFLRELLGAGLATGALSAGRWTGDPIVTPELRALLRGRNLPAGDERPAAPEGPFAVEPALAAAALLSASTVPYGAAQARDVLAAVPAPAGERAVAVLAAARAAVLAWGTGAGDEADRVIADALGGTPDPAARQRLLVTRAAADLHRARGREALDGAADARELTADPEPGVAPGIAAVESLAAALTGQATAAVITAGRALDSVGEWRLAAPREEAALEFARGAAFLSTGGLDQAEAHSAEPWESDLIAWTAVRSRVLRERGRIRAALECAKEGARLLRLSSSVYAGPCLGGLAQVAVLAGDLPTAHEALAEAERRAVPSLRALWFPVALARPWVLAAQGAVGAAVHDLLDAAAAAEGLELRPYALMALHDVVRLGAAGVVADRLVRLAEEVDGDLAPLYARHAVSAAAGDALELEAVSAVMEGRGMPVLAAEAAAQAAEAHWDKVAAARTASRAWVLARRCDRVTSPALARVQPDLTLVQYEIADHVAAGRGDREIAERMELTVRAVSDQVAAACTRLGVPDRAGLAALLSDS